MGNGNEKEKLKEAAAHALSKHTPSVIERNPKVDEKTVALIKESWRSITAGEYELFKQLKAKEPDADPCLHFYDLFFEHLYRTNPDYRDVFRHAQSPTKSMAAALFRNVNAALNVLTKGKAESNELKTALKSLAERLCKHGVKAQYYGPYVLALFETLKLCGAKDATYEAWVHVYSLMFNEMLPHVVVYDYEQEKATDKKISGTIVEDKKKDDEIHKILILGPGEAGKTTLFRQLIHNFGEGWKEDDKRKVLASAVRVQVVEYIAALCTAAQVKAENQEYKEYIAKRATDGSIDSLSVAYGNALDPAIVTAAKALWADPAIQDAYKTKKHVVHVPAACAFYMDRIDAIQAKDYIPTFADILQSRQSTTGIVEAAFEVEGEKFKVFDVGGQKNERRKWIHHFEKVDMIIFMVAMDQYDQGLFESSSVNRLTDALDLWAQTCNLDIFKNQDIILFLNRIDLLRDKIKETPITIHEIFKKKLSDTDAKNEDAAVNAIRQQFYERSENKQRKITTFITQCTSSENIAKVFVDLKNILPKRSKRSARAAEIKENKADKLAAVRTELKETMAAAGKAAF